MAAKKRMSISELQEYRAMIEALPRFDLSPTEAAPLLGVDGWSLNISAKAGRLPIKHFFAGRNLRLSKADVLSFCGELFQ